MRVRVGLASQNCDSKYVFTETDAAAIRSSNSDKFPFKFNRTPVGVSAQLSFNLFNNFQREQTIANAQVQRENALYSVRARELQMTTEVTQAYLNLTTAAKTVALQEQIGAKAQEELSFAEQRYRVGAATFLEVTTAHGTYQQALIDRVNSIY